MNLANYRASFRRERGIPNWILTYEEKVMAEIKPFKAYPGPGKIAKPAEPVQANIVTVQD